MTTSDSVGKQARRIYYFDTIHDYPAIGGVVEFSRVLQAQLQRRYGERLVSAREALRRHGLADPGGAYFERERQIAQALAERDPGAVFFFPNFHSPIQRPASGLQPTIINVVHDVQFAHLPELFSDAQLEWLHRAFAATCERADEIVFASRTTRDQFMAQFGVPRRHRVVYHPVQGLGDESLAECAGGAAASGIDAAPFLLTATHSDYHPHKNMAGLLRLFAGLAQSEPALQLYVTGHGREKFLQVLQATLPQTLQTRVRHLGYVPRAELERLYTQAKAYVSLSRFEGFNMPAAEAASRGTPLILSDLPVHRELYAGQACLVDLQAPSVQAVARFLRQTGRTGPQARQSRAAAWPHRARCTPVHVGAEYVAVIEACGASRRLRPHSHAARSSQHAAGSIASCASRLSGSIATYPLARLARAFREVFAAGAVLTGVAVAVLPLPARADGGQGGGGGPTHTIPGGAGGSGYDGQSGGTGQDSYYTGGGGGGGAGGGLAGAGATSMYFSGGTGGAGGANGNGAGSASIVNAVSLQGGNGDNGVDTSDFFSGGGGGGAGGYGAIVTGSAGNTNSGTIAGGLGGNGGAAGFLGGGGGGGDGGVGLLFTAGGATLANTSPGSIAGGAGGAGGASTAPISVWDALGGAGGAGGVAVVGSNLTIVNGGKIAGGAGAAGGEVSLVSGSSGTGGAGGMGGAAIMGSSLTIANSGTISGGNGGAGGGGAGEGVTPGAAGAGGVGIVGSNLAIVNSGTITGGMSGDGIQADAIRFTGGANTLELDPGFSISGAVDATAGTGSTLILGGAGSATFDASLIGTQYLGFGTLEKTGTGTWTLNNATTSRMSWIVDAGTLAVGDADHSSASILGDVQVNVAGTLRGHGSIAGNVNSIGTVWPGGSIGTLTIGGNYTQSPSGTLQIEVSPTAASQLKVGGTATLAGTLSLLYAPGTYTTKTYTLVSASSINGTFSTVTGGTPSGVTQSITYASNAVDLNLTDSPTVQPVVVAPTQATIFGAVGSSALRAGQGANEVLLDRLAGPCGVAASRASSRSSAGGNSASASGASGPAAQSLSCPRQGNGLWIQAQGTDTRIDGNHGVPDSRDRRYGFLTGVDHQWKGWTVGVAGGYSHADVTESGNGSKGTLDTLRIAGYGAKNLGAYTLAGTLGYAYDFSSTTRSFGALGSAKGDGHGQEFTAGLQASRPWSLGPVVLTPRLGVRYAYLDGLGTDETGPTAQNLGVANQHLQSLQPYVGVTLDYPFTLRNSDRPASVQLRAGYAYETQSTGRNVSVTAADGTGFVIAGTRDTRGLVTVGLGATLPVGKSTSAYVRYDSVLHTGNVNAQSLQAGVDYRF